MNKLSHLKYFIPVTLSAAVFCGIIDFNSYEVQLPALCVIITSSVLSFLNPKYSWISALLIGTGIMFTHLILTSFGFRPAYNAGTNIFGSLLALIIAAAGTIIGIFVKKLFNYNLK